MSRTLLILLALVGVVALVGAAKRRSMVDYLAGKTPTEAREMIVAKATPRAGEEKANLIADRVVEKLEARGVLAPETA